MTALRESWAERAAAVAQSGELSTDEMSAARCELRWYLVHCKPREEVRAQENLQRQGFECYRPLRPIEPNGKRPALTEALFPGYLFIHLDHVHDNWYPIRSTRGVIQIVRFNTYPLPVRDEIIEGIRARLAQPVRTEPHLKPGERVQITAGPFSQLEAIFVANDGDERVVLLLCLLQQDQHLSFPAESVRKLRELR